MDSSPAVKEKKNIKPVAIMAQNQEDAGMASSASILIWMFTGLIPERP
jgi:hypothetical protein